MKSPISSSHRAGTDRSYPTTRQMLRGGKHGGSGGKGRFRAPWFAGYPCQFRMDWTRRRK